MLRLPSANVDLDNLCIHRDSEDFPLTTQEAQLLAYLAERAGRAVQREELHTEVFGYAPKVVTRAADAAISRLRQKLEVDPRRPTSLLSVRGLGYRLEVLGLEAPSQPEPAGDISLRGRGSELSEARRHLDADGVVQLVGPGGAGKTRLARALCNERDGRFIDLSTARSRPDAWNLVAASLGLQTARLQADRVRNVGHALRASGRLVVLDNLEQLPSEIGDDIARLDGFPLILTSRGPVVSTAPVVQIGPLDADAARQVLIDAATRVSSSWQLPEPASLDPLAQALDRLPLALELVGARLPPIGAPALLQRLGPLLAQDNADDRHGSLFSAIRWSWSLLSMETQRQLAWWSVFVGDIDMALAEAVSSAPGRVFDAIAELQATALLDTSSGSLRPWVAVRAFAQEQLRRSGEVAAAKDAHATALLAACPSEPQGEAVLGPFDDWAVGYATDLQRAAQHSLARHPAEAARLSLSLLLISSRIDRSLRADMERLAEQASRDANRPDLLAETLIQQANNLRYGGHPGTADSLLDEAEVCLQGLDRPDLRFHLHRVRGSECRRSGRLDEAEAQYRLGLAVADGAGMERRGAQVRHDLGATARRTGRLEEARELHLQAQMTFRRLGDERLEIHCLMSLASIERVQGRAASALRLAARAIEGARRIKDPYWLAECLSNASNIHSQLGEVEAARTVLDEAISIERAHGHLSSMTYSLGSRGGLEDLVGRSLEAEMDTREALAVAEQAGAALPAAFWRYRLAEQAHRRGALDEAQALYKRSIRELDEQHARPSVDHARAVHAILLAQRGDADGAQRRLQEAQALLDGTRDDLRVYALCEAAVGHLLNGAEPQVIFAERGVEPTEIRTQPLLATLRMLFALVVPGEHGL